LRTSTLEAAAAREAAPPMWKRAGLADRLRGHDADRLADVDDAAAREVAPVAGGADAVARGAGDRRTDLHLVDAFLLDLAHQLLVEQRACRDQHLVLGTGLEDVLDDHSAEHALAEALDDVATLDQRVHGQAVLGAAVDFRDHEVLRHVDQATREVARVRGLQRGVREALAGAVGRDEVLQHVETFTEVRRDRRLDDRAVGLGHQAAHAGELADLGRAAAGARVGHHEDRVEGLLLDLLALGVGGLLGAELLHHRLRDLVVGARPDVDDLVVALAVGDEAGRVLVLDLLHLAVGAGDDLGLLLRDHDVVDAEGHRGARRVVEARVHQPVGVDDRVLEAERAVARVDRPRDRLLGHVDVDDVERQPLGQDVRQQRTADGGLHEAHLRHLLAVDDLHLADAHLDARLQLDLARLVGAVHLADVREHHALALRAHLLAGHEVEAEHDVLRRHDDRVTVGGREDVVGRHHQRARLELGLERQRHVHGHLVAVEVRVERGADQRVQLDRLALDQHRLEGLDAEAVQRRRAVQQHRMLADDLLEDVPDLRALALDQALGRLDRRGVAAQLQLLEDERLEELERHLLRQAALVQAQRGPHDDDRAAGVVDALAEQVLAEPALLALDHVGERLQRALVGARDRAAAAAVVEQRVDGLLQHALLVAHDDVRRVQLEQPAQAVVAVDDPAIEVVEVRRGEAAAIERHQRTQVGRQHRQDGHDHPFRLVAGLDERLDQLQALAEALQLGLGRGGGHVLADLDDLGLQVERAQQLVHGLGTHAGVELVAVLLDRLEEHLVGQQLAALHRRHARVDDHEGLEVQHALDLAQRHVEHQADARRQRLQEPDVRDRRGELDVAHALAAHLRLGDLDAALLADDAAVLQALVLAAKALVVLHGPEDLGAEQAVAFRLERAVVDRLRLLHLAVRPGLDHVGRRQPDLDRVELFDGSVLLEELQKILHFQVLRASRPDWAGIDSPPLANPYFVPCHSPGAGLPGRPERPPRTAISPAPARC